MPLAEEKGVTLVLEHLDSRDSSHPMEGHPGYFGDHVDFCVDLIKAVGSPNMKLLFDIITLSIMDGDIIRRIRQHKDVIGHYHTAGNPGRQELDDRQEYQLSGDPRRDPQRPDIPAIWCRSFIPTWEDHELALRHAAMVCDV